MGSVVLAETDRGNDMHVIYDSSIKTTVRSRGRTALFLLLLSVLTAFLMLCVLMLCESRTRLNAMDDAYTTLGVIEYYGDAYPNAWGYDETLKEVYESFDKTVASESEHVISYAPSVDTLAYAEGYLRRRGNAEWRNQAILLVKDLYYVESHHVYMCTAVDSLYSFKENGALIAMVDLGDFGLKPDKEKMYALNGTFVRGESALPSFVVSAFPASIDPKKELLPWAEITDSIPAFKANPPETYREAKEFYTLMNGLVSVYALDTPERFLQMQQQQAELVTGRLFTNEEIEEGSEVCVVSEFVLGVCEKQLGDTIRLSYIDYENGGFTQVLSEREYEIVGTLKTTDKDRNFVCMPTKAIPQNAAHIGYTIGTAHVKNEEAAAFLTEMNEKLPERMGVSIYDQGYARASASVKELQRTATYLTVICVVATLGVLLLFGFVFVYRQRESVGVMQALGAGKRKTVTYLLFGALLVALAAALIGAGIGSVCSGLLHRLVTESIENAAEASVGFGTSGVGFAKAFESETRASLLWPLLSCLCIPLAALVCCLLFARKALKAYAAGKNAKKQRKVRAFAPAQTRSSRLPGGAVKFALLSVLRGGWRTLIVPLTSLALLIFLAALCASLADGRAQLDTLAERTPITGYFTDARGRAVGELALPCRYVNAVERCPAVTETNVTYQDPYMMLGVPLTADGRETDVPDMPLPDTSTLGGAFQMETLKDNMLKEPDLVATNNPETVPEFFYSGAMRITFLDGFDETIFRTYTLETTTTPYPPCIVTSEFMNLYGLSLGDSIRLAVTDRFCTITLTVVGSFIRCSDKNQIYMPFSVVTVPGYAYREASKTAAADGLYPISNDSSYASASFRLESAARLDEFYEYLSRQGYGTVGRIGKNRLTIIVQDAAYLASRDQLERQIRYLELLLPILFTLVCALGFVISYLMMAGRNYELAMMRALGARRLTVFLSYFLEYLLLLAVGAAIAIAVWAARGTLGRAELVCTGIYVGCYLIGCTVGILRLCGKDLLVSLGEAE